jgi:hypothetical protein
MQYPASEIKLSTNNEGPCAESLGLYDLLDSACKKFNYPKSKISLQTCNLVEQHQEYQIDIRPQFIYLNSAKKVRVEDIKEKKFDGKLKHFGLFIGHSNLPRLHLSSHVRALYKNKTCQTFHYTRNSDYHKPFLFLENMISGKFPWKDVNRAIKLVKQSPIVIDEINQYPILSPETFNICKIYNTFFVDIVCLTYFSGNTFYIDEKIWRPMLSKTPFIVQGPQFFLQRLQHLGFKTFKNYWSEGYSEDPAEHQNHEIFKVLKKLSKLSIAELANMYEDMKLILDHNYNLMHQITKNDFMLLCRN